MMGGRTKIGIGRTTRVKAVSVIAWGGKIRTLCTRFISNTAMSWIPFSLSWNQMAAELQEPCRKLFFSIITFTIHWKTSEIQTYSMQSSNKFGTSLVKKKKSHLHVLQRSWRILLHSQCCPGHQSLQTAHCVSSDPHYRCLHSLDGEIKAPHFISFFKIHFHEIQII